MDDTTIMQGAGLEIAVGRSEASTTVRLKGRVDIDSSPELRERLLTLLKTRTYGVVIVDLNEVPYIDTSGVATLIEALKIGRLRTNRLCLQGLTGSVLHFFEVTGVLTLFNASECSGASPAPKES